MDSAEYFQGITLFNQGAFFKAHEILEDIWRVAAEPKRRFLQALIQTAVALHHHSKGNCIGARSLLKRAALNLEGYPEDFGGLALAPLRQSIAAWQEALDRGNEVPPLPKLTPCDLENL